MNPCDDHFGGRLISDSAVGTVARLTGEVVLRITVHTDGYSVEATPPLYLTDLENLNPLLEFVMQHGNERINLARAPRACRCGDITKLGVTHYADRMCTVRIDIDENEPLRQWVDDEVERRVAERLTTTTQQGDGS